MEKLKPLLLNLNRYFSYAVNTVIVVVLAAVVLWYLGSLIGFIQS